MSDLRDRTREKAAGLGRKLKYEFDNTLSKGIIAQIGWLLLVSFAFILLMVLIVMLLGLVPRSGDDANASFWQLIWLGFNRTLDPGYLGEDKGGIGFLIVLTLLTFFGILVFSILISIITSWLETRLHELRRGHSLVVESNHTVIFGWSSKVISIVGQLVEANRSLRRGCVVVYGDHDKVEMEDEIAQKLPRRYNTRVVCRSGPPTAVTAAEITNVRRAKSVIVVGPDGADADIEVIKTLMAVSKVRERMAADAGARGGRGRRRQVNVVAAIRDPANHEVARVAVMGGATIVDVRDLTARLIVQTSRQSGLPGVFEEILSFEGCEFYFTKRKRLVGRRFGDILFAYNTSVPVGFARRGKLLLNPDGDEVMQAGDQLILLAEDDDQMPVDGLDAPEFDAKKLAEAPAPERRAERILFIGWNDRLPLIIQQLDEYAAPGSEFLQVSVEGVPEQIRDTIVSGLKNFTGYEFREADTRERAVLEALEPASWDEVVLLSNTESMSAAEADAHTLVKLLHLRDIVSRAEDPPAFVTEMLDVRNRRLAEDSGVDDFVVSDEIISMMLAQVSENPLLADVFAELLDASGSEIYMRAAGDYVKLETSVTFYDVTAAAARRGEVAMGYRILDRAREADFGITLNPRKSDRIPGFRAQDRIVVLARGPGRMSPPA